MTDTARFVVNYHFPDGREEQDEFAQFVPAVGTGYIMYPNESRYRVEDVWYVEPKRGSLQPHGIHVFLREAGVAEDRPLAMFPDYYGSPISDVDADDADPPG